MDLSHTPLLEGARTVARGLADQGYRAYFTGGCVRDWLLGRTPGDIDIATDATPDKVLHVFPNGKPIGRAFGVVQVHHGGHAYEIATFRADAETSDGRRPDHVRFTHPEEDAARRDFTINGMFLDPGANTIIDHVGGRDDLARRQVKAIGDPTQRFAEDHLRMLRAVRFATVLNFTIEPATFEAVRNHAPAIREISSERIYGELNKILTCGGRAGEGIRILQRSGLLKQILPEVEAMVGQEQPPAFHPEGDVFTHTTMMLDAMEHPTLTLAYAVLLHDVGKPPTAHRTREPDGSERIRFNHHAQVGAAIADDLLRRLRMPNRHREAVVHCVHNHMRFMDVQRMRKATLRRMMGARTFPVEMELHRLDCLCSQGDLSNTDFLHRALEAYDKEPVMPERWITGEDLLALGMAEGPELGRWLAEAYERQLDESCAGREELLAWIRDAWQRDRTGT